jgi:hypothetical protein
MPLKETPPEKEKDRSKSSKKGGNSKKKAPDKNAPKKYVLTLYKEGCWRPLNPAELAEFTSKNPEVASYLANPEQLSSLKLPPVSPTAPIYDHWDKVAKRIITHLLKEKGAWHFHRPVDPEGLGIPDYANIIKRPMDFGTIKQKLNTSAYNKCQEFIADVELVFSNCITYNGENSEFGILAKTLRTEFTKQCQLLCLNFYM